jgi:hypothetical protein
MPLISETVPLRPMPRVCTHALHALNCTRTDGDPYGPIFCEANARSGARPVHLDRILQSRLAQDRATAISKFAGFEEGVPRMKRHFRICKLTLHILAVRSRMLHLLLSSVCRRCPNLGPPALQPCSHERQGYCNVWSKHEWQTEAAEYLPPSKAAGTPTTPSTYPHSGH